MHTLQVTRIDEVTRSRLSTVTLQTRAQVVAQRLSDTQIGLVVVCDPEGLMAGVISKTDIVRQMGPCLGSACRAMASELMTKDVISCRSTDLLHDVLTAMQTQGLVHVPVLGPDHRPVGVLNARDALRTLVADGEYEQALLFDYVMGVGYH